MVWLYNAMEGEMAQRLKTITQHVFAFTGEEITAIIDALIETGRHDIAEDIYEELPEGEECEAGSVSESVASLKLDLDSSGVTNAANEFERLAEAIERISDALKGDVTYESVGEVCVIKVEGNK